MGERRFVPTGEIVMVIVGANLVFALLPMGNVKKQALMSLPDFTL